MAKTIENIFKEEVLSSSVFMEEDLYDVTNPIRTAFVGIKDAIEESKKIVDFPVDKINIMNSIVTQIQDLLNTF